MKKLITITMLIASTTVYSFSVSYSNKDSKSYKMDVKLNGTTRPIEFKSGTNGTASVSMSASNVEIKSSCGWTKVDDGDKVFIKGGCLKVD